MSSNSNIPKLKVEDSSAKHEHLVSSECWTDDNIEDIMTLWTCTQNYIRDSSSTLLDKCDFNTFLDFVIINSTHYRSFSYEEEF